MNISINGNELIINSNRIMLTHAGIAIFKHLMEFAPNVVSFSDLQSHLRSISRCSITQQITVLRKAIKDIDGIEIKTHFKVGYALSVSD